MNKKKPKLTLEEKSKILSDLEDGTKAIDICKQYGVSKSTISKIRNNKENIQDFAKKSIQRTSKIKRISTVKVPDIENALYQWFLNERLKHNLVNDEMLRVKALEFHKNLNSDILFMASHGWIQKFKKRHSIQILKISGEKLSANDADVPGFIAMFKNQLEECTMHPEQIYNADETGLVFKNLNLKTLVTVEEKTAPGRKNTKERITVMSCVNATGQHKLPLMVIGRSKHPRSFKNVNLPNIHYRSSKNAWQTRELFKEWFHKVFVPEVKTNLERKNLPPKAILLLDNASSHCFGEQMKSCDGNITVMFFPPNTTSILQPLDQNILKSLKTLYRKKLLINLMSRNDENLVEALKSITLKDVVFMLIEAWNEVKIQTIKNGFKHLFGSVDELNFNLPLNHFSDEDDVPLIELYRLVIPENNINDNQIIDWANGGNERSRSLITDEDIIENINIDEADSNNYSLCVQTDEALSGINLTLNWAESNLPISDILFLRNIREKIILKKIGK